METRAQIVSRVSNELRLINKDEYFSRRAILSMLESKIKFLLSQKMGERNSLFRESQLYSTLECFELEKVEKIDCPIAEFKLCRTLMKSKHKIPELVDSKFYNNILSVTAIDSLTLFSPISLRDYATRKNRKYSNLQNLVYIEHGGYIYIPDYEVYAVNLDILTLRVEELLKKSKCSKEDCCKSYWDYPLINSDKLAEVAIGEVIQEVRGTFRSIQVDENPNKDSNIKSQTIN